MRPRLSGARLHNAAALLCLLSAGAFTATRTVAIREQARTLREDPGVREALGPLVQGMTVNQEFVSPIPSFDAVSFQIGTYARRNTSVMTFTLQRHQDPVSASPQRWRTVGFFQQNAADIEDNAAFRVPFPRQDQAVGRSFRIVIASPDGTASNAVALWVAPGRAAAPGQPRLDGDAEGRILPIALERTEPLSANFALSRLVERTRGILPEPLLYGSLAATKLFGLASTMLSLALWKNSSPERHGR